MSESWPSGQGKGEQAAPPHGHGRFAAPALSGGVAGPPAVVDPAAPPQATTRPNLRALYLDPARGAARRVQAAGCRTRPSRQEVQGTVATGRASPRSSKDGGRAGPAPGFDLVGPFTSPYIHPAQLI